MAELTMLNIPSSLQKSNADRAAPSQSSGKPLQIPLSDIAPDPDQPRKVFDRSKISTIAAQFKDERIGQIEAITVKSNPSGKPKYLLVSGENRYRAGMLAQVKTLRAEVVETASYVHQVLSNETRTDLSAFDKARAYKTLIDSHGYTQGTVAKLIGKADSYISDHMKLFDLPDVVKGAAESGKALSVGVLSALRMLAKNHTTKSNKAAIAKFIAESETITKRDVQEFAKSLKSHTKAKPLQIDGKSFKVLDVADDIMTIKRAGVEQRYKLTLVD